MYSEEVNYHTRMRFRKSKNKEKVPTLRMDINLKQKAIPSSLGDVGLIKVVSEFSNNHPKCHLLGT